MRLLNKNYTRPWISFLLLAGIVFLKVALAGPFEEFSLKVFDRFQRLKPRLYEKENPVVFVDINDTSLSRLGQWPWPRTLVAELLKKLKGAGAAALSFDIVFAEPDRTSPGNITAFWPDAPESIKAGLKNLPDHDAMLAQTMAGAPVVTGFILTGEDNGKRPLAKAGFAFTGDDPKNFLPPFNGAVVNLPEIEKAAAGNGSFNFIAESDGILRRVPVVFRLGKTLYPSLFAEALRVAQGASGYIIKCSGASGETSFGEKTGIVEIKTGSLIIPTDSEGKIWLYDTGHAPGRFIPAWKVLEKDFDPKTVEGKIVFIGSSASGLQDLRATPLNPVSAGTEIHVQLAEQILTRNFLYRPDWAAGAETIYLILLGLILILFLPLTGALWCALLALAVMAAAFAFSWSAFTRWHLLFDPAAPSLACLVIYLAVSLLNYLRSESERRHIRGAFSRYLAPEVVKQLAERPEQLRLGGELKEMTVLFADIRGFTAFSEQYTAGELTHFMNRFLTPMTDIILKHRGTIDKYIGDCIMAFWNAPLDDPRHAQHACESALAMQEHLKIFNRALKNPISLSIGINTGKCCVGNMGSDQRFDYSVLGDDVNLASRLQNLSGLYGADILLGANTANAAKSDFALLEVDLIQVKGKNKPVRTYALLGNSALARDKKFEETSAVFRNFLQAYRERKWDAAESLLANLVEFSCLDTKSLQKTFLERIRHYKNNPPQAGWAGVFTATTK